MSFYLLLIISSLALSAPADNSPLVSHELWNELLKTYVTPDGKVNYPGLKKEERKLHTYLDQLQSHPPLKEWSREEQMAYWINVYNASTIDLVLKGYPCKSIKDLENGKPWDLRFIEIGETKYSLNQIEHEILRKKFNDPRIHFAINCASVSCPKLHNEAFTLGKLESQLNMLAQSFVNDPHRNILSTDEVMLSSIFDWYKEDFTTSGSIIDFLNKYSRIRINPTASVSYLNYDWSLNE